MDNKKKILIIEDTAELSKIIFSMLQEVGFEVEAVSDGAQGIEKLKSSQFHLILLDLVMPKKSGFEVMGAAQELGIKAPIIIFSNMPAGFSKDEVLKMGATEYIEKNKSSLEDVVERITKLAA